MRYFDDDRMKEVDKTPQLIEVVLQEYSGKTLTSICVNGITSL